MHQLNTFASALNSACLEIGALRWKINGMHFGIACIKCEGHDADKRNH